MTDASDLPRGRQLITAQEAARHLGVARETLRRWTAAGLVPVVRDPLTGRVRYSLPALDRWLEDNCPPTAVTRP